MNIKEKDIKVNKISYEEVIFFFHFFIEAILTITRAFDSSHSLNLRWI